MRDAKQIGAFEYFLLNAGCILGPELCAGQEAGLDPGGEGMVNSFRPLPSLRSGSQGGPMGPPLHLEAKTKNPGAFAPGSGGEKKR